MAELLERLRTALADCYRIEREIGSGGMATVFLAQDLKHPRQVALKVLDPEIAAVIGPDRFSHEIALASRLQHPHILTLLDSGAAEGLLYYVMPYVEGESLRERLRREPQLPLEEALRLTTEVGQALEYAHRQGVVHRDIKPENILLSSGQAMVADFGIARAVCAAGGTKLTETGIVLGTPQYMSPEQTAASKDLDGRSDQYSLGCVLYEMLAGRPPFVGPAESLAYQHQTAPVPAVTTIRPAVPAQVDRALVRALAKTPADRFASANAFVEALGTKAVEPTAPPARARRSRRGLAFAAAAVVLVVLGMVMLRGPLSQLIGPRSGPVHGPRQWIMVAELDAPPEDAESARATRELVSAALDQSTIVTTVTQDQVRETLRAAGRPDTTRLTADLARELAYRGSVRAVVTGQMHHLGNGYALVLRVLDVERDSLILAVDGVAPTQDALIPTVERLARQLRQSLGEHREAVRASRPVDVVATPSLEAYRKFVKAGLIMKTGDSQAALPLLRQAIALDPDFATAYRSLGTVYGNLAMSDSARWAYEQAARRSQRLSEVRRLLTQADLATLNGDVKGALAVCDAILAEDSTQVIVWNRRMVSMISLGRFEEALRSAEEAAARQPFGSTSVLLHNIFVLSLGVGDLERARHTQALITGPERGVREMWLAEAGGEWSRAESLATAEDGRSTPNTRARWHALRMLAAASAARGQVMEAGRFLDRARALDRESIRPAEGTQPGHLEDRSQLLLAWASGVHVLPPPRVVGSDTMTSWITMGLRSAVAGDTARVKGILVKLHTKPQKELALHGAGLPVLEALMAYQAGQWARVTQILQPVARQEDELGAEDAIGRPWPRWLMAEAWEKLGRPDSAAAYFELATSPGTSFLFQESRLISSYAHQRLVLLYSGVGRIPDAERHWEIFSETFTHPDPEVAHLVQDARTALASGRGMSGSLKR